MSQVNKKSSIKVQRVLQETNDAFRMTCDHVHVNTDYADYASASSLSSFQKALKDPDLTYDKLCKILRRASIRENHRQCKTPWSLFMANYIQKHSNSNAGNGHA